MLRLLLLLLLLYTSAALLVLRRKICFSGWHVLAKVALNDGVNAVALAMSREACATVLMFAIARRYRQQHLAFDPFGARVLRPNRRRMRSYQPCNNINKNMQHCKYQHAAYLSQLSVPLPSGHIPYPSQPGLIRVMDDVSVVLFRSFFPVNPQMDYHPVVYSSACDKPGRGREFLTFDPLPSGKLLVRDGSVG